MSLEHCSLSRLKKSSTSDLVPDTTNVQRNSAANGVDLTKSKQAATTAKDAFIEWEDDRVADDDYEEGLVFDDDPYEEEIVSGDVGVNLVFKDELEMGDDVFVPIGEEVVEGSEIPEAMFSLLE
nr:hypothetical protein [Tanacetum cinerariifolium]